MYVCYVIFVDQSEWKFFQHPLYWIYGELCFAEFWVFWIICASTYFTTPSSERRKLKMNHYHSQRLFKQLVFQLKHSLAQNDNVCVKQCIAKIAMLELNKSAIKRYEILKTLDYYILDYPDQRLRTSLLALKCHIKAQVKKKKHKKSRKKSNRTIQNSHISSTENLVSNVSENKSTEEVTTKKRKRENEVEEARKKFKAQCFSVSQSNSLHHFFTIWRS